MLPGGDSPSLTVVPTVEVERATAKYSLGFKIVVVEADDVADRTGYCACNGKGSSHPPFRWEGVDVDK